MEKFQKLLNKKMVEFWEKHPEDLKYKFGKNGQRELSKIKDELDYQKQVKSS